MGLASDYDLPMMYFLEKSSETFDKRQHLISSIPQDEAPRTNLPIILRSTSRDKACITGFLPLRLLLFARIAK
jgi:hypothetical protein